MIKKILLSIVAVVVAAFIYSQVSRPDTFRLASTVSMKAPAEKIFLLINDFGNWPKWSPYEKLDPNMKKIFAGSPGSGASYSWNGNSEVGAGNIQITESVMPTLIRLNLNMTKPFECHNKVEFTMEPKGEMTDVTWAMTGPATMLGKFMGMLFADNMVREQFTEGLTNLKTIAEQ